MPKWQSRKHLEDHFADHGGEVGARTVEEYDASARALLGRDDVTVFAYEDWETNFTRVGIFDANSGLFTFPSDDELWIVSHFRAERGYIRGLMGRD